MILSNTTAMSRCLITLGMAAISSAAFAQATPADTAQPATQVANAGTTGAGEIVVTAQKRSQRLQDVPVAVQVVTGEALTAQGVRQFADLTKSTPSLLIRPSEQPVNNSISIRGIGTVAFSPSVEPSVAVQIDDVPVQFIARAFADLSDIERVEVLRGPQSTLYGRAASAGLINIVTQAPTSTLTGRIGGVVTTDREYAVNGAISGPLTDTLGFRLNGNYDKFDGNVHNLTTGDRVNGFRTLSLKGKVVWDPTTNLNIAVSGGYIDGTTTIGRPFIRLSPDARLRGVAANTPAVFAPGITATEGNTDVTNNINSGTNYNDYSASLRASLDLGFASLMSITGYDKFKQFDILDQDESPVASLDNRQFGTFRTHSWSQELRLVAPGKDRFRYTLGLYYSDLQLSRVFQRGPFFSVANWYATNGTKQYAAFGQLEYDLFVNTTLIGGARAGKNKIDYTFTDYAATGVPTFAGNDSANYETYKAGIQQKFTPDIMGFVTFATGYKGQAYDIGTGFNLARQQGGPVQPERSKDWQIGLKTQFFDRRLTFNVTLFDTRFRNFQAQGIEFVGGAQNFRLTNVGRLSTKGVEIEGGFRASHDLNFTGGVTYDDAKIKSYPTAQCYPNQTAAQGCVGTPSSQNLAGYRPPQAPKWKLAASGEYTPSLTQTLDGVLQASYSYQSGINFSINQDPQTYQPGYGIANLSIGVRAPDKKWEAVAFVNNLFDKHYFSNMNNDTGNHNNSLATLGYLARDYNRYGGVRVSYNF